MWMGATIGVATTVAVFAHLGLAGAPWLVNVALAKLAFAGSAGLMAGGAVTARLGARQEQRRLGSRRAP
jgi:hypothetical protein